MAIDVNVLSSPSLVTWVAALATFLGVAVAIVFSVRTLRQTRSTIDKSRRELRLKEVVDWASSVFDFSMLATCSLAEWYLLKQRQTPEHLTMVVSFGVEYQKIRTRGMYVKGIVDKYFTEDLSTLVGSVFERLEGLGGPLTRRLSGQLPLFDVVEASRVLEKASPAARDANPKSEGWDRDAYLLDLLNGPIEDEAEKIIGKVVELQP